MAQLTYESEGQKLGTALHATKIEPRVSGCLSSIGTKSQVQTVSQSGGYKNLFIPSFNGATSKQIAKQIKTIQK